MLLADGLAPARDTFLARLFSPLFDAAKNDEALGSRLAGSAFETEDPFAIDAAEPRIGFRLGENEDAALWLRKVSAARSRERSRRRCATAPTGRDWRCGP